MEEQVIPEAVKLGALTEKEFNAAGLLAALRSDIHFKRITGLSYDDYALLYIHLHALDQKGNSYACLTDISHDIIQWYSGADVSVILRTDETAIDDFNEKEVQCNEDDKHFVVSWYHMEELSKLVRGNETKRTK